MLASASANTLAIDNRNLTFPSLTDTTVTMTGRSELHLTGTGDPLPGCVIHLNSPDAWLFLREIRPFTVNGSFLGRIRVNGTNANSGTNVRVVQHGIGTVVIPYGPSFTPLTIHSERRFGGNAMSLPLHTYHNNSNLGSLAGNVRSFRLKRGYMATMARNENGTGPSRVFIAQDDDVDVTEMPADPGSSIRFIRVLPWRWVAKKGWAGAGDNPAQVDAAWFYNWNNNENSFLNREYVPIRQTRWWPSYDITNAKQNVSHLLGFNEPDSPDQANMTVAQAIAEWPNLMRSGLRLGSPAPTDGGLTWLYQFMDEADALGYRVDFVAVHFYRGGQTATQLYNWLRDIHLRTGRPLWVTEWNNGANWTCCAPSSYEQQATIIKSFAEKMDEAPFVERYAVYNWLNGNRELIVDGNLTSAGVVYRDHRSPIGFVDAPPQRLSGVYDEQVMQANAVDQEMPYSSSITWTTGIGQTLGASQVIPLGEFKTRLAEAAANGFGGVVDFERGTLHGGQSNGQALTAMFDDGRKSIDFTNHPSNGGQYSISSALSNRTAVSGERFLTRSGTPNFDFDLSSPLGFVRDEKITAAGLTVLGRSGVSGTNHFRVTAWYTNGTTNGSTSVRRQINTSTGNASADTFAGIAAPPGHWITRITVTSENGAYTGIDDLAFITSLQPEFLWAPGGTPGGAGVWDAGTASWTTGDRNLPWIPGRTAIFSESSGNVNVATPIPEVAGMTFETSGYHIDGPGSLAFATGAEIRLNASQAVISTALAGNPTVNLHSSAGSNQLQLRGDNRGFSGTLAAHPQTQIRPYHGGDGATSGHELGAASATVELAAGSQARWFNPASAATYPAALRIAGNGIAGGNPGVLNLDSSVSRTLGFDGPVTLTASATVATQNHGSFVFNGPITGAFPLTFNLSPGTTSWLNGSANLGQLVKNGGGTLAFGRGSVVTAGSLTFNAGSLMIDPAAQLDLGSLQLNVPLPLAVSQPLTLAFPVNGPGTLSKSGAGTLTLAAANGFGPADGNLILGSGSTNAGILRLSHPQALGNHTKVSLNSGQGGVSGLELAGGHVFAAALETAGRSNAITSGFVLRNVSGNNTWDGPVTILSSGGSYGMLSESGILTLGGDITSEIASNQFGARLVQFSGAGDIAVSGKLRRAGTFAMQDLSVTKTGTGTLTIAGGGDYSGPTNVNEGTLRVDGSLTASGVTVAQGARLSGSGSIAAANVAGTLALIAGQVPLVITGALTLQNAALEISGTAADGPVILATYGTYSGNFASISGMPAGWHLEPDFDNGTALALVRDSFSSWSGANAGGQGPAEDFDQDGIPNLIEYAVLTNPNGPDASVGTFVGDTLGFAKRPEAVRNSDVAYEIEVSSDLASGQWTTVTPDVNDGNGISYTLPGGHTRMFARLKVTQIR
jgi:autotransporter-associated beta strand protein